MINQSVPLQQQVLQPGIPSVSYQPVQTPLIQTPQVATQTTVLPQYGAVNPIAQTQLVNSIPVQSSIPLATTAPVQSNLISSTQPQTKYRLWNMLVPAFRPEPQPVPVPAPQPVVVPEPVVIPEPVPEPVYTPTYEEPVYEEPVTYTVPETTYVDTTQYETVSTPNVRIIRRGSGITMNEQNSIISCASNVLQNHLEPISNKTAQAVKRTLGGDWLVIVYPDGKPIDFNMTCVQGNDYLYFIIDNWAFQVCRLR